MGKGLEGLCTRTTPQTAAPTTTPSPTPNPSPTPTPRPTPTAAPSPQLHSPYVRPSPPGNDSAACPAARARDRRRPGARVAGCVDRIQRPLWRVVDRRIGARDRGDGASDFLDGPDGSEPGLG